jgi:hypothetical protein
MRVGRGGALGTPPLPLLTLIHRITEKVNSRKFAYLTREGASGSAWAAGPRKTLRAIHPPPTSANSAPTTEPTTENGQEISGA